MAYMVKEKQDIFLEALRKLQATTQITAVSPGSVARAITEAISVQLGDLYNILDFNFAATTISGAQGRSLDLLGSLFDTQRKTLSDIAAIDKQVGAFYFYLDQPALNPIVIPLGTNVYTTLDNIIGTQHTYATVEDTLIAPGRLRAYATIIPRFADGVFTAGPGTLTVIDPAFTQPAQTVRCTNPKAIESQIGFESDENYRTRLIKAVRTAAGGTTEAIRFAGLNINGVRDITIRDAPYGLGSYEALIVSEDNLINGPVVRAAGLAMEKVRPVGVRMFVRQPDLIPVAVSASIVVRDNVTVDINNTLRRTEIAILRYLNTMLIGTPLIYTQLLDAILGASDVIADVTVTTLSVNGTEVLRKNYIPAVDQQLIPGTIKASIAS